MASDRGFPQIHSLASSASAAVDDMATLTFEGFNMDDMAASKSCCIPTKSCAYFIKAHTFSNRHTQHMMLTSIKIPLKHVVSDLWRSLHAPFASWPRKDNQVICVPITKASLAEFVASYVLRESIAMISWCSASFK